MRNFYWKAFKTKKEAINFCSRCNDSFSIYNVKTELNKLYNHRYSDCLAVYQGVDPGFNFVVEWVERI